MKVTLELSERQLKALWRAAQSDCSMWESAKTSSDEGLAELLKEIQHTSRTTLAEVKRAIDRHGC
jgi:hypothetical protein